MDERPRLTVAQTVAACLGIAALTLGVVAAIYATEPEARQEGATRRTAMLVELATAERGTFRPRLEALGTVRPSQDVALSPRGSGQVQALSEDFVPGRTVAEGEPLVFLDPADARNRLAQQQSALRQARSELALERGRQAVAKIEREQIEGDISADQERDRRCWPGPSCTPLSRASSCPTCSACRGSCCARTARCG